MQLDRDSMNPLYGLFGNTVDAVFGIDENRQVRFWNKGCEDLLGLPSQQALGRTCAELICGEDIQGNKVCGKDCPIAKFFDAKSPNSDFDLIVKSGNGKPVMVNVGSYYTGRSGQIDHDDVQVFHSMRPVNSHQLIQRLSNNACSREQDNNKLNKLSKREYELLRLLSKGTMTKIIAHQLDISPATVRNHVKSIYAKLDVHNRAEAVAYAVNHGMI